MSTDVLDPPDTEQDESDSVAGAIAPTLHDQAAADAAAAEPVLSPDELKRQHYEETVALGRAVDAAKHEWSELKAQAAEAKKEYEGLNGSLLRMLRRDPMQRPLPLGAPAESDEPLPVDDSWRKLDVNQLTLTPTVINHLYTGGIMTLGDLSDFWKAEKVLTDIKGIGEASDVAVRDAFSEYGVQHPELFEGQAGDAEPGDEADDDEADETDRD